MQHFNPENHCIELAGGGITCNLALKKGTVKISLRNTSGNIVVGTLDNVLCVTSYSQNIFSTANGASVNLLPDSAQLVTRSGKCFILKSMENCIIFKILLVFL